MHKYLGHDTTKNLDFGYLCDTYRTVHPQKFEILKAERLKFISATFVFRLCKNQVFLLCGSFNDNLHMGMGLL